MNSGRCETVAPDASGCVPVEFQEPIGDHPAARFGPMRRPATTSSCDGDRRSTRATPGVDLPGTKRRSSLKTRRFSSLANADRARPLHRRRAVFASDRHRCLRSQEESAFPAGGLFAARADRSRQWCERRDPRATRRQSSRSSCSDVGSKSKSRPIRPVASSRSDTKEHGHWRRRLSSELADCTPRRQSQSRPAEGKKSRSHLGQWKTGSARGTFPSCVCSGRVFLFSATSDSPDAPHVGQDAC